MCAQYSLDNFGAVRFVEFFEELNLTFSPILRDGCCGIICSFAESL